MTNDKTVNEKVGAYISQFGFTNTGADRIWFHDFCHILTGELGSEHIVTTDGNDWGLQPTNRSEIIAAVYQSVLLCEKAINPKLKELRDGNDVVSFRSVFNFVVPQAMEFLGRGNVDIEKHVTESEMYGDFQLAGHIAHRLEERFGDKIGNISREEIGNLPMAELEQMIESAKSKLVKIGVFIGR